MKFVVNKIKKEEREKGERKNLHVRSKLNPSFWYRFRRLLTKPLIGFIAMCEMVLAIFSSLCIVCVGIYMYFFSFFSFFPPAAAVDVAASTTAAAAAVNENVRIYVCLFEKNTL